MKSKINKGKRISILIGILIVALLATITGCSMDTSKSSKSKLVVDSKGTEKSVATIIENEKVYVSLKEAFEYLGGKCTIEGKFATATKDKDTIKVDSNGKEAYVNSAKIVMSEMPKTVKDDIYVPIDFLNEAMDARVNFDKENKTLNIRTELPLVYTKAFSVKYIKGGLKKVTDAEKRTLILAPQGKEVPEEYKNEIIIKTPIKNVLLASTTQACLLRPINEISSIGGVTTPADQWQIEEVKKGMESGKIAFVGENTAPDYEKITALKPEIAFIYTGGSGMGDQNLSQKFDELKINYAVENGWLENDPFGRMEWIKFIAAFYDKEEEAEKYFNEAVKRAEDITKKAVNEKKPKVAWATVFKGDVYIPKSDSYVVKMIEMAGGEYIFKESGVGSGKISLEEFYAKAKDADVFIYSSTKDWSPTLKGIVQQTPTLGKLNSVKNKKVWCYHPDYYQVLDKTDELIIDLTEIFNSENNDDKNVKHFIKYTE